MVQVPLTVNLTPELPQIQDDVVIQKFFMDRTPANWTIQPVDENLISAINGKTQENFEGTIEEFNALLRG